MNKTFQTIFALIGIFLCGAIVGGVVSLRYVRPATVQKKAAENQLYSQQWMRIANRLNLTPEQHEKYQAIITVFMQEQQNVNKATKAATDKAHADILGVLTPVQGAEYEAIRAKMRESDKAWQRWYRDQRAKYGDLPLAAPPGVQLQPQQSAGSPANAKDTPVPKRSGGKQGGGKKQSAPSPALAPASTTTGTDAF